MTTTGRDINSINYNTTGNGAVMEIACTLSYHYYETK